MRARRMVALAGALAAAGCGTGSPRTGPAPEAPGSLPEVEPRTGPLAIDVVYPGEGQAVAVRDSTFIFGNLGTGGATLTIDGAPVEVAPNGAFLAFLPVPADGRYDLVATAAGRTAQLTRTVRVPAAPQPQPVPLPVPALRDTAREAAGRAAPATPAFAPRVAVAASARADGTVIGTAVPGSGTPYHWFFPNGTRLPISGVQGDQYRVRLTDDLSVWVDSAEVDLLPTGAPPVTGSVGTVAARPADDHVDIRLSTSQRFPFRVDEAPRSVTITVYGAEARTNVMLYGRTDPLIERMEWEAVADDVYRVRVELARPLWGYRPFWDESGNLVVRLRRPPAISPDDPIRGRFIAIDAGHPPGGAIGPTRLTEAEATLAVSKRLVAMLRERGARVLETRPDSAAVALGARPEAATAAGAELLVSVHFDAFPDGINPFENHGTHVFYNQAQSIDFARSMQREILQAFGLRDLGISRRDLALVRPTWMPSVLTESAFLMIPRNEAAMRRPEVQERLARAHLRGIENFLRERAVDR